MHANDSRYDDRVDNQLKGFVCMKLAMDKAVGSLIALPVISVQSHSETHQLGTITSLLPSLVSPQLPPHHAC